MKEIKEIFIRPHQIDSLVFGFARLFEKKIEIKVKKKKYAKGALCGSTALAPQQNLLRIKKECSGPAPSADNRQDIFFYIFSVPYCSYSMKFKH